MAGHSHWANIARKKTRVDNKRGKLFAKLSRAIIVAAQHGGGDPDANLALRYAIDKARRNSMPMDNIERAVRKGCGESSGEKFEELLYEGYGPAGVAVLCEVLTENRNRTASEVRRTFEVHGGNLGATGCVAWMFDRRAVFAVSRDSTDEETLVEAVLDDGADDVVQSEDHFVVTASPENFQAINAALETASIRVESAEITQVPQNTVELDAADGRKILCLLDALGDNDDIQCVTANFSMPDDVLKETARQATDAG